MSSFNYEPLKVRVSNENYSNDYDFDPDKKLSEIEQKMLENERRLAEIQKREEELNLAGPEFGFDDPTGFDIPTGFDKYDPTEPTRNDRDLDDRRQPPSRSNYESRDSDARSRQRSTSRDRDSRRSERDSSRSERNHRENASRSNRSRATDDDDILEITEISKGDSDSRKRQNRSPKRDSRDGKRSKRSRSRSRDRSRRRSRSKDKNGISRRRSRSRSRSRDRKARRSTEKDSKKPSSTKKDDKDRRDTQRESRSKVSPSRSYSEYKAPPSRNQHDHRSNPVMIEDEDPSNPIIQPRGPKEKYINAAPPVAGTRDDPNDFFNDDLRKAIKAGRIKMTEEEMMDDGPMYTHTTNGKELEYQICRVFVGHLPVDYLSKDDIYHQFEKYGKIISISLHRGFAFIQFKAPEMARHAASSENGRRCKGASLEVNMAQLSKEEARKLPREGATLPPIRRSTPQCRIFIEGDNDRLYATQIERKLRILGVSVDTTIWMQTVRRQRKTIEEELTEMQNDDDSICAVQISKNDQFKRTCTVHIFKPDPEEHRNMPVVEALILINVRVQNCRKQDQPPPGRIASILRLLTDGRQASLLEVEEVVEWLEKKRVDLGGFPRTFSTNECTDKLKSSIADLIGGKSYQKITEAEQKETVPSSQPIRNGVPHAGYSGGQQARPSYPPHGAPQYDRQPPPQKPAFAYEPPMRGPPGQQGSSPQKVYGGYENHGQAPRNPQQHQPERQQYVPPSGARQSNAQHPAPQMSHRGPPQQTQYQAPRQYQPPQQQPSHQSYHPQQQQPPSYQHQQYKPPQQASQHLSQPSGADFNALPDMPRRRNPQSGGPPAGQPNQPSGGYSQSGFVYGGSGSQQRY